MNVQFDQNEDGRDRHGGNHYDEIDESEEIIVVEIHVAVDDLDD